MKKKTKVAWPKTLGACIDLLYKLKQERLAHQKEADAVRSTMAKLGDHLLETFSKDELRGGRGKIASCVVDRKEVPNIENPAKLFAHIKKTGDFDLLQRRLNDGAIKDRWERGKTVPGIGKFSVVKVRPHKLGAKDTEG